VITVREESFDRLGASAKQMLAIVEDEQAPPR
jgi:hypothetical protein